MGLTFTMAGFFPVSAIVAGALADLYGLRAVAIVEGFLILALAAVAWRVVLRQIVNDHSLDLSAT